ncbi:MAG TPA: tetratricopeptide repeat protein [Terriglobales bacterium]|nr:tetratricopeptide repeat protein [Terriglobales bacterium]
MAFGFGFNKQKVLSAAEKYVQQGKLQNAIAEYEKILKADPKDLTVLNTVGDLYSRNGEVDKATECFKKVGDAYAAQGFTVKGIAMYKKIGKLKPSLESVLKLAELYTQQGLFNDARAQYLQVAEEFLRAGELEQSVRIFQKILEMDPENVAMRVRLAEVYIRLGKKNEAWQIFSAAAETLRNRGSRSGAEEILQRMLTLDPGNSYALLLRARNAIESGDAAGAIPLFQKVNDLDNHPDGMRDLLKAYLQTGRIAEAAPLAGKLLTTHNDGQSMFAYVDALVQNNSQEDAVQVIDEHADRLLAENSAKILETLRAVIGPLSTNPAALEKVLDLFHRCGDQSHDAEVNELLAHASVQSGDLARARDLYQGLAEQEPQNSMHMQNYQQVVGMMGGTTGSKLLTVEEGIVLVEELEATAPPIDQQYSPEIANALRAAITDTELFVSYNMPDKALGPLMAVLPIAPSDVRLNQRLAALYTRSERFPEAAACCRTLASVYNEAGLAEEGSRYEDLARRCEEHAATTPGRTSPAFEDEAEIPLAPWPLSSERAPAAHASTAEESAEVHIEEEPAEFSVAPGESAKEIDLSDEWDGAPASTDDEATISDQDSEASHVEPAVEEISAETSDAVAETIEEIRFYLEHSMADQARAAFVKLQSQTADYEQLAAIQTEIDAAAPPASAEVEAVEEAAEEVPASATHEEAHPVHDEPSSVAEHDAEPATPLQRMVADLDSSLGESFLPHTVTHEIEQDQEITAHAATDRGLVGHLEFMAGPKHKPAPKPEPEEQPQSAGVLGEFVADLESSLGDSFLQEAPVPTPEPPAAAPAFRAPVATSKPAAAQSELQMAASAASGAAPHTVTPPPVAQPPVASATAVVTPQPSAPASTFRASVRPAHGDAAPARPDLAASVDLADMFGEIRHELEEEVASADEDPETHYNLGVAFREMGLLDEAIGELQKVCQAIDHGHGFPQVMQTYTWLAQCFLDKGVPEAAIRWYQKALALPSLDQETRTALHYELASSYETAQDRDHALQHFMEVYGSNIDYRDVGERIKALKS